MSPIRTTEQNTLLMVIWFKYSSKHISVPERGTRKWQQFGVGKIAKNKPRHDSIKRSWSSATVPRDWFVMNKKVGLGWVNVITYSWFRGWQYICWAIMQTERKSLIQSREKRRMQTRGSSLWDDVIATDWFQKFPLSLPSFFLDVPI